MEHLAELIRRKNLIDAEITSIINRPAQIGHAGEYIAALIFDIQLVQSAAHKAIDGHFRSEPLAGKSVNIKWYTRHEGLLDITPEELPDYYLVMNGPKTTPSSSREQHRPWSIRQVYLFPAAELVAALLERGTAKVGIATSVPQSFWNPAQIYPQNNSTHLLITPDQARQIALFQLE